MEIRKMVKVLYVKLKISSFVAEVIRGIEEF